RLTGGQRGTQGGRPAAGRGRHGDRGSRCLRQGDPRLQGGAARAPEDRSRWQGAAPLREARRASCRGPDARSDGRAGAARRTEAAGKAETTEKAGPTGKSDKAEKTGKPEKTGKGGKGGKADKTKKAEKTDTVEKQEKTEKGQQVEPIHLPFATDFTKAMAEAK